MARRRKNALTNSVRQDAKSIEKQSRQLLKQANKSAKEFRKEISALKKAGVISSRVDARKQRPTRYMLSKIRKFADVLEGRANLVKAPKEVRRQYTEKGIFEERNGFLVVPKDYATEKAKIAKGMVAKYTPLKMGEERRIVLPFRSTDLEHLAEQIKNNEDRLDDMKEPTEQFGFQLYGHNSLVGFPDADTMAKYILGNYQHLLMKGGRDAMKHFVLLRFKNRRGYPVSEPIQGEKIYSPRRKLDPRDPAQRYLMDRKREKDARRKKLQRQKETPEQKEKRLAEQRVRTARNRQRKFLEDL